MHPIDERVDVFLRGGNRFAALHQLHDLVEDAADRSDEIPDVVGEVAVVDRDHADIVADQQEAGEMDRPDIVETGKDFVDVLRDRSGRLAAPDRRFVL